MAELSALAGLGTVGAAVSLAVDVGLLAGAYPTYHASRLNTVEALRGEQFRTELYSIVYLSAFIRRSGGRTRCLHEVTNVTPDPLHDTLSRKPGLPLWSKRNDRSPRQP